MGKRNVLLLFVLLCQLEACATWAKTGRAWRSKDGCDSLGVRPASEGGAAGVDGAGITGQWRTCRIP